MHPCLAVQEIFSNIVVHVTEGDGVSEGTQKRRTLAALARTCKTFYPVATSRLWAVQDTLNNLMGCLPESSWLTDEDGSMVLREDFPKDGWTNFDFHAHFVHELFLSQSNPLEGGVGRIERTLSALARFHPEAPHGILPRVSVVHTLWASAVSLIGLLTILGNNVRCFQTHPFDGPGRDSPDVDAIRSIPPSLRGLDIRAHSRDLFRLSLARWASSIRELRLQGANLALQDLTAIALLPHLLSLELDCMSSWREEEVDIPSTNSQWFSSLEDLVLRSPDSASNCTTFLEKFRPGSLTKIMLEGRDSPPSIEAPPELDNLFAAFSTPELSRTLTHVNCEVSADFHHSEEITFAEIEPLCSLSLLTTLSLYFECEWHFTEHDFNVIAGSWPSLKELLLWYSYEYPSSHGRPTTQALVNLARHPQLEEIVLSFNSSVIVPTAGVTNTRIRILSPCEVLLEPSDIPAMAEFLRELLPTVYERGVATDLVDDEEGWGDLNNYIQSRIRGSDGDSEDGEQDVGDDTDSGTDIGTDSGADLEGEGEE